MDDIWMMVDPDSGRMIALGSRQDITSLADSYMKELKYRESLKQKMDESLDQDIQDLNEK